MNDEYKEFLAALGAHVRQLRKDRGWKLRDMVIQHGYSDSQWRKYESGGGLTIPSLLRIAGLFGVSIAALLNELEDFPRLPLANAPQNPKVRRAADEAVPIKKRAAAKDASVQAPSS